LVPDIPEHKESKTALEALDKKLVKVESARNQASYDRMAE